MHCAEIVQRWVSADPVVAERLKPHHRGYRGQSHGSVRLWCWIVSRALAPTSCDSWAAQFSTEQAGNNRVKPLTLPRIGLGTPSPHRVAGRIEEHGRINV